MTKPFNEERLKKYIDEFWDDHFRKKSVDWWLQIRDITQEDIEKFPNAKTAAEIKKSKLYKVMK